MWVSNLTPFPIVLSAPGQSPYTLNPGPNDTDAVLFAPLYTALTSAAPGADAYPARLEFERLRSLGVLSVAATEPTNAHPNTPERAAELRTAAALNAQGNRDTYSQQELRGLIRSARTPELRAAATTALRGAAP